MRFELIADQWFSCYNASSHLDMRVEVKIPGSLESSCMDERGDKRVATDALWLETFLCAILRAYWYADDGSGDAIRKIVGVRRFNPITNTEMEHKFLDAAERLFFMGTVFLVQAPMVPVLLTRLQAGSSVPIQSRKFPTPSTTI